LHSQDCTNSLHRIWRLGSTGPIRIQTVGFCAERGSNPLRAATNSARTGACTHHGNLPAFTQACGADARAETLFQGIFANARLNSPAGLRLSCWNFRFGKRPRCGDGCETGNFRAKAHAVRRTGAKNRGNSGIYSPWPPNWADSVQGILNREQGIFANRTGNFCAGSGNFCQALSRAITRIYFTHYARAVAP
jgi:hypothetical protein